MRIKSDTDIFLAWILGGWFFCLPAIVAYSTWKYESKKPELKNYNLEKKLPKPQNEIVVHDRDIAANIKRQKEMAEDFCRMRDSLKGWDRITWHNHPIDSASIYPKSRYSSYQPTLYDYSRHINKYEINTYNAALKRCKTKYKNYNGKQR